MSTILGVVAGLLCIGGSVFLNPGISAMYLFHIMYLRIVLGFFIGILDNIKLIEHKIGNPIIRGAIIGAILSIPLLMVPVPTNLNYLIAGIVFGILIDFIASKVINE